MIKQDFQDIANFLLSDRCTFKGSDYIPLTKMIGTLREAATNVGVIEEEKDAGSQETGE